MAKLAAHQADMAAACVKSLHSTVSQNEKLLVNSLLQAKDQLLFVRRRLKFDLELVPWEQLI